MSNEKTQAEGTASNGFDVLREKFLAQYLPEALRIIRALNERGQQFLPDAHQLPTEGRLLESLAYALALENVERERRALSQMTGKERFSDECAAISLFAYRIRHHTRD